MTRPTVLVKPTDPTRITRLWEKLAEYQGRIDPFRAPELQMDAICKRTVLLTLLRHGRVDTHKLSREMAEQFGSGFDPRAFDNACAVIEDYIKTGGQSVSGGTGLR